jgi:hypothetical protein
VNLSPFDLLVLCLATWRLAYMVTRESGPFDVFTTLRERLPLGGLTSCIYCASVWAALLLLLLWHTPAQPLLLVLAIAGGALMFGSYSGANHPPSGYN